MNRQPLYPAKTMNATEKKLLAIQALNPHTNVSELSKKNKVSRKFIQTQKNKIGAAVDHVFDTDAQNNKILFHLPVTKEWLQQFVLSLILDGHASFRGVQKSMESLLDHHVSIGTIFNIVDAMIQKSKHINAQQDLSPIKCGANDELYQSNKPVLTGVDLESLYCFCSPKKKVVIVRHGLSIYWICKNNNSILNG